MVTIILGTPTPVLDRVKSAEVGWRVVASVLLKNKIPCIMLLRVTIDHEAAGRAGPMETR
jgi:hypothetical protein